MNHCPAKSLCSERARQCVASGPASGRNATASPAIIPDSSASAKQHARIPASRRAGATSSFLWPARATRPAREQPGSTSGRRAGEQAQCVPVRSASRRCLRSRSEQRVARGRRASEPARALVAVGRAGVARADRRGASQHSPWQARSPRPRSSLAHPAQRVMTWVGRCTPLRVDPRSVRRHRNSSIGHAPNSRRRVPRPAGR